MNKSNIESGFLLIFRDGTRAFTYEEKYGGQLCNFSMCGHKVHESHPSDPDDAPYHNLVNNLSNTSGADYDIVQVWGKIDNSFATPEDMFDTKHRELLWERPKVKHTKREIEVLLGCDITIVEDKNGCIL